MRLSDRLWAEFQTWGHDEHGWALETRRRYALRAKYAHSWLLEHRSVTVTRATVRQLKDFMFTHGKTARNRNDIRQALVAFYAFLIDKGYRDDNPPLSVPRLKEPTYLPKALSARDAVTIWRVARAHPPETRAFVALMLFSGLRKEEVRTLEWRSVSEGWLRVEHGKGDKERVIPLHGEVAAALRALRASHTDAQWLFPSPRNPGRPVCKHYVGDRLNDVGREAGIHLHPHLLRHTAATGLMESGADLRTIQEFLGHSDPKTTAVYTRVRPVRLREAIENLNFAELARSASHRETEQARQMREENSADSLF